ncbi:hypothetical protein BY458DRAFT_498683 [Sporodiniella umbellata]|nr:hypothetical protein BY458DRAFT_498683 [Sporodiniella umbellata]
MSKAIVIGAGVSGLTTGICLLRNNYCDVSILSKHLPGDLSSEYTSPWAGASIITAAKHDDYRLQDIDLESKREFSYLADNVPEANVIRSKGFQYISDPDVPKEQIYWVKKIYDNVRPIPKDSLIPGAADGYTFDAFTVHVPKYLQWLLKTFIKLGGRIERCELRSIDEAMVKHPDVDVFVNCSGLGSFSLSDVNDKSMFTLRGQTVLVRAPHIKTQHYNDSNFCWTYIIPRNDGTVICGGTVDPNNKLTVPDKNIAQDILKRVYELCPDITHGKGIEAFDIISHNVGFRPARKDGIRLEKETRVGPNGKKVVICHNYGHGSYGYQSSWGSSQRVIKLLKNGRISKL